MSIQEPPSFKDELSALINKHKLENNSVILVKYITNCLQAYNDDKSNERLLRDELSVVINKYSLENNSDTPDYILAKYLIDCLHAYDDAVYRREKFWARDVTNKREIEE